MSDEQESGDAIQVISHKFRSVTTIEPTCNVAERRKSSKANSSEEKRPYTVDGKPTMPNIPELNLPERILFVIDTVKEPNSTMFKLSNGTKYSALFMIKRIVENFVCAKSTIQRSHEYAIITLNSEGCQWICDYTNNIKTIVNHLDTITEDPIEDPEQTCDIGGIFETTQARLSSLFKYSNCLVPAYVARVILIYARSNCIPKFHTGQKCFENLTQNPYFFLDALYVHEPPSEENICEEIYAEIAALDTISYSYIFEVGRNATKIHDNMAKLLAHPLQRPLQRDACYSILPPAAP